jgi:hypothetical protein
MARFVPPVTKVPKKPGNDFLLWKPFRKQIKICEGTNPFPGSVPRGTFLVNPPARVNPGSTRRARVPRQAVRSRQVWFFGYPATCQKRRFGARAVPPGCPFPPRLFWNSPLKGSLVIPPLVRNDVSVVPPGCPAPGCQGSKGVNPPFFGFRSTLVRNFFPPGCSVVGQKRSNVFDDFSRQAVYLNVNGL